MTEKSYPKIDIAIEYLDAAMQMYLDQRNYFCAIHLAAAAAELMDHHLPKNKRMHDLLWKAQSGLHQLQNGKQPTYKDIKDVLYGSKNARRAEQCYLRSRLQS